MVNGVGIVWARDRKAVALLHKPFDTADLFQRFETVLPGALQ